MEFRAAYGEAMFRAHLIEDLLALHIYECSYFHVNDYKGLTRKQIRELEHHERIDELLKIYPNRKDGSIERLVKGLGLLGSIRNKLTHAFIPQVGSDLRKQEGVDQIIALLRNISTWEGRFWNLLKRAHEAVLRGATKDCLKAVLEREDPPFDARVARSKIQEQLDELKSLFQG
jgi:hypothetical protein